MYWGKDYKQESWLIYDNKEFIINKSIPQNLELFTLTTNWFDWVDKEKEENNWINIRLITILLNRLNTNNAIVIDQYIINRLKSITIWTEHEAEESTPSPMCTSISSNITEFDEDKVADLWKHICEKVKSRRVILKKREEDNIIEVNSVVPHSMLESEDYNLLSSDYEKVKDNFSCPVDNWICKPASLWWWPFKITKEMYQFEFENLTEEKWEEIIRKIWDLSTTKNIKQLKVSNMIKDFSSFENLLKIKEVIPNAVIVFDFKYEETKSLDPSWEFEMITKAVTCVFKGREWNFEQIDNGAVENFWRISDTTPIENNSYAILKMNRWDWINLVIKERSWVDNWVRPYIDELKKNTETNDDIFIIADLNNWSILTSLREIDNDITIIKYFKHIIIWILSSVLKNKESIEKINNLPKKYHYELWIFYEKDTNYDFLNLINPRIENLSIEYLLYPYEIKIKRPNSAANEPASKWNITPINRINRRMIKTDSEYLKALLFTM